MQHEMMRRKYKSEIVHYLELDRIVGDKKFNKSVSYKYIINGYTLLPSQDIDEENKEGYNIENQKRIKKPRPLT